MVDGVVWEYIVSGAGRRTFLVLPGGGQNAQSNWRLIKEFENTYKVIVITIHECNSIEQLVDVANKILRKENIKRKIVLYGLSIGALMAQSYTIRNKEKVTSLIISHGCTPHATMYKRKVIIPLQISKYFLPIVPNRFLKLLLRFSGRIQGKNKDIKWNMGYDKSILSVNKSIYADFLKRHWDKKILNTWIKLHLDFYRNERFDKRTFENWKGKVLILRTDNDPLMQDEGWFEKIYPNAKVHTFKETGHLTYYYQFEQMVRVIKDFLSES